MEALDQVVSVKMKAPDGLAADEKPGLQPLQPAPLADR